MKNPFAIMNEAISIATNFHKTNQAAQSADRAIQSLFMVGDYFVSPEERKKLIEAQQILQSIQSKTGEWDAQKYCEKNISIDD